MAAATSLLFMLLCSFLTSVLSTTTITTTIPLSKPPKQSSTNPNPWEFIAQLTRSTVSRAHQLKHPPKTTTTHHGGGGHNTPTGRTLNSNLPIYPRSYGGYSLTLSFGTPPQQIPLVMDTGSSLVWSPCTSHYICTNCTTSSHHYNSSPSTSTTNIPVFHPNHSTTFHKLPCHNPKCSAVFGSTIPCNTRRTCPQYAIQYGLGFTLGVLLTDKLNLPGHPTFVFGCSILSDHQPEGIAGFGRGPASLPNQLRLKGFSYCFVSHKFDDTKLISGNLTLHSGDESKIGNENGVIYTPFVKNPVSSPYKEYYYVTLTGITVGGKTVNVPSRYLTPGPNGHGGTIIDSGSTFTFMEKPIHEPISQEFANQMSHYKRSNHLETMTGLGPCYNISSEKEMNFPTLDLEFSGGGKMSLPLADYISMVRAGSEVAVCMTIVTDMGSGGMVKEVGPAVILGNYQQQNFYVEFDLGKGRFGFKPKKCG